MYPFKTVPYKHQLACWLRQRAEKVFAFFAEMGTGKSKMLIDTIAWLYDQGFINAVVIVAPKAVYRNWADSELPTHMPAHVRYKVGIWTAEGRKADLESLEAMTKVDDDLHVLLVNVESLARAVKEGNGYTWKNNRAYVFLESFLTGHRAMMAVDESTVIKNPTATRTKALMKLRTLAPYRRILSGQPAVNGPLDLYSQCEFLDPHLLGFGSFFTYKAHFAKLVPMHTYREDKKTGKQKKCLFHKVNGYRNLEELKRIISTFSFIVKKEDCLDLPPKVFMKRQVEMGPKQRKAHDEMRKLCVARIERHLDERSGFVQQPLLESTDEYMQYLAGSQAEAQNLDSSTMTTAKLVITQMLRLHQIRCGFLVTDDRQIVPFDEPNPRVEDLMEALEQTSGKVIIWATWKFNVSQIATRIAKDYGPESVVTYYGPTSTDERRRAIADFQNPDSPVRFFVSNKTGARGLTLTASHTSIYFSYDDDLDTHDQSQDRNHRIGQTRSVTYVFQYVPGTGDEKIMAALRSKQQVSRLITPSNWREFI